MGTAFEKAKWIWADDNRRVNDWVVFNKTFTLGAVPAVATMRIAAETKYYLWVNGTLAVFDGGLLRESTPGNGYFDEPDIARFLVPGKNTLTFRVWFFGNGGRNNVALSAAGLIFESATLGIFSDAETLAMRDAAHFTTANENPSYLYGGHNIGYDARQPSGMFSFAVEYGGYPSAPWNLCEKRPIPLMRFSEPVAVACERGDDGRYAVRLPYAMHCTPWFTVTALGGEVIDMRGDRYEVNGGPGDPGRYYGHRTEYICKSGRQTFESLDWMLAETLYFTLPPTVKVDALGYRESGYDTELKPVRVRDFRLNRLLEKCLRTLYVCMRDNFMDCPDRERGQWIGDVSVQAPQVFYGLTDSAVPLLKKAVYDFIRLRKGDVLVGNVPGDHFTELPAQSLHAIGEHGMIAVYYDKTRDTDALRLALTPCVRYLMLFNQDENGLIAPREGNWEWYDHLYNIDGTVIRNAWYYSAVTFVLKACDILGDSRYVAFLSERKSRIEAVFDRAFWNGRFYASGAIVDDRANALAVICGLAGKDKWPMLTEILTTVFNASAYMEGYVLEALCQMGERPAAYRRMLSRFAPLIDNENTTLWEDFYLLGTKNHAWTGSPLTIVCRYFPELLTDIGASEAGKEG